MHTQKLVHIARVHTPSMRYSCNTNDKLFCSKTSQYEYRCTTSLKQGISCYELLGSKIYDTNMDALYQKCGVKCYVNDDLFIYGTQTIWIWMSNISNEVIAGYTNDGFILVSSAQNIRYKYGCPASQWDIKC